MLRILLDHLPRAEIEQPCRVITARRHQIAGIGRKDTIPYPLVVLRKGLDEFGCEIVVSSCTSSCTPISISIPRSRYIVNSSRLIRATGDELSTIGRYLGFEEVGSRRVCLEFGNGYKVCGIGWIPEEDVGVVVGGDEGASVFGYVDGLDGWSLSEWFCGVGVDVSIGVDVGGRRGVCLGSQFIDALGRPQIPNSYDSILIPGYNFRPIRMVHHGIDRRLTIKRTRGLVGPQVKDLDGPIFGSRVEISDVSLEAEGCDSGSVSFEGEDGVWTGVGAVVDFEESYLWIAASGDELFVGCDFEAVHGGACPKSFGIDS